MSFFLFRSKDGKASIVFGDHTDPPHPHPRHLLNIALNLIYTIAHIYYTGGGGGGVGLCGPQYYQCVYCYYAYSYSISLGLLIIVMIMIIMMIIIMITIIVIMIITCPVDVIIYHLSREYILYTCYIVHTLYTSYIYIYTHTLTYVHMHICIMLSLLALSLSYSYNQYQLSFIIYGQFS